MNKIFSDRLTAKTFAILQNAFDELEISAYLIGAQARDVWFLPMKSSRISRDIDWVIANSSKAVFNELKMFLIQQKGFSETSNPLKIKSLDNIEVDLIPFDFPDTPHFVGLNEIFERGTEGVTFDDGKTYQVATLPAIILLKFIAFSNRPEYRSKDILDIAYILRHFEDYSDDYFIFLTEMPAELASARIIGRKINHIIADSLDLKSHFITILETQIANPKKNKIAEIMIRGTEKNEDFAVSLLAEILKGVSEGPLSISAVFS
jgi:predicted nucleotidyltransferase